jgi:hypothetical protein
VRLGKLSATQYFAVCFFALLAIGVFLREGIPLPHLFSTIDHILDGLVAINDPGSFAQGASDVAKYGWLTPADEWILHLWPPGFVFLEAALLRVFGFNVPIIFALLIISCAFLAGMLLLQRDFLRPFVGGIAAAILPFTVFLFPVARIFLIEPFGIMFGETFSVACFISGVLFVLRAIERKRLGYALLAGISFALAAYFRSQYESLLLALTASTLPLIGWQIFRARRSGSSEDRESRLLIVKSLIVSMLAAHFLMMPWRVHNFRDHGSFTWVQTMELVIRNSLTSDKALLAQQGDFVIKGGGNLSCVVEPSYCDRFDKALFFKAFFNHMGEWYRIKISLLETYWFTAPENVSIVRYGASFAQQVGNAILLICIIGIAPLMVVTRKYAGSAILLWANVSFFGGFFVIFSLVQFETRYFYVVKLYGFTIFLMLAAIAWHQRARGRILH